MNVLPDAIANRELREAQYFESLKYAEGCRDAARNLDEAFQLSKKAKEEWQLALKIEQEARDALEMNE